MKILVLYRFFYNICQEGFFIVSLSIEKITEIQEHIRRNANTFRKKNVSSFTVSFDKVCFGDFS